MFIIQDNIIILSFLMCRVVSHIDNVYDKDNNYQVLPARGPVQRGSCEIESRTVWRFTLEVFTDILSK